MRTTLVAVAVLAALPAMAGEIGVVGADEVHGWLMGGKAVLVDARPSAEFEQAHIVGAINIPPERIKLDAARLPPDRRTPIIFYCRGAG